MKTLLALLLMLLSAAPSYAMDKGQEAPNFKFEASWGTLPGARQLTDYRGRIVFLEIWKIHWEPCIRFMPHLVEVNEKYRDKGVEIIMATDVDKAPELEKFIADKKLKLGVARVPDIYKLVKAQGYPTSYGIDVDGNCIWRGHPQQCNDSLIEGWLKDLRAPRIPRKLHDALSSAVNAYDNGQYGAALNGLEKLLKHKDEKIKADAQYVADLLNGRLEMNKAAAVIHRNSGDLERLVALLEADARDFSGLDYAKDCASEAKKAKAGKAYKECVEAREKLARLKPTLAAMKPADAQKALTKLSRDYPDTPAGKEAAELAREFEGKK